MNTNPFILFLSHFIYFYQLFFIAILLVSIVLAFLHSSKKRKQLSVGTGQHIYKSDLSIPVSIIAAALNESKVIISSLNSLLNQNYPEFEVILIDDGSTDDTIEILTKEFKLVKSDIIRANNFNSGDVLAIYKSRINSKLTVISKVNKGSKADAMNCGLNYANYRYVCCVDGDTTYQKDAIFNGMSIILKNPGEIVGATSYFGISSKPEGFIETDKRVMDTHWLSIVQNIDLMRSFLVNRMAFSSIGAMMCSPGAFALWRKDLFTSLGGFDVNFSCEDIEFTYRVHEHFRKNKIKYQIASLPELIAMTEGPDSINSLIKQRARWQRVLLESVWSYKHMAFNSRYGVVGMIGIPYNIMFEALSPLIQLISIIFIIFMIAFNILNFYLFISLLLIALFVTAIPSIMAILIDNRHHRDYSLKDILVLSFYSFVDLILFKPIIFAAGVKGTIDFLTGKKGWDKFERNKRA